MPNPGGTIYALGAQGMPWIKIGCTTGAVEQRLKQLQTGHPFPLEVVATVAVETDARRIEKQVHAFLAEAQRRGEWFEMPMDLATLEALIVRAVAYLQAEDAQREETGYIDMRAVGERVLLLRRRMDLSQHALAAKAGIDVMTISRLERGDKKRLEVEPLARLAQALGVTTDHLLGLDTTRRPRQAAPVG